MLAIIGGTGLTQIEGVQLLAERSAHTALGSASSPVTEARLEGQPVLFLARHGHPHRIPPHRINYRANLLALQAAGATRILAINAVGGIDPAFTPGSLVLPDQIIDYTWGREATFFDGDYLPLKHLDFTWPYDKNLRKSLLAVAAKEKIPVHAGGVYGATQGPRLETAAEITRMARDGCTLVGMTGMPEAMLARELELPYACLSLVVNPAAGLSSEAITMAGIEQVLQQGMGEVLKLLRAFVRTS
ncbi:S-methyl-5'-thioinosine phosphorylase [Marinospirillum alkaliphilum]|uniref:Probable S-methyl-5'-thioinosine phosphorylase n=1 Tax=Marinospirillum alkaliphilum DSM 21637 TaxID=1122209 RepID=A0A1K1U5G7_9GAMM|nr:S-methyl-5'-thioinosine phosphorylase [Marinospirillum alkaliphilum]SFX08026.1 5'-methylthioadenosine phosphorylase [Marinospirillum alkaliphilum DSM 21637]